MYQQIGGGSPAQQAPSAYSQPANGRVTSHAEILVDHQKALGALGDESMSNHRDFQRLFQMLQELAQAVGHQWAPTPEEPTSPSSGRF